ncbi:MAG: polysaccharide deacetylase family protein, partial [Lachnospiraceae bacterium]|nr:polysaccharide deacetylase family protein [Lachnospiraceae bacterium]
MLQIGNNTVQIKETMTAGKEVTAMEEKQKTIENTGTKKIAITFDDGPHPQYTKQLLDGLKERGVKATFFVTGEHAELHPDIIERMNEEGHLIGNHTYSHIQLNSGNREEFKNQLIKTNEIISEITGNEVLYVRPPYGSWDKKFESDLNMFPVRWKVDPK